MSNSLRALLRGSCLATVLVLTASLIMLLPGTALAQDGQIDEQITKTMWVMHPTAVGHIDRLDQLRVPYQGETEIDVRDLFSHPVYTPRPGTGGPDLPTGALQTVTGPLVAGSSSLTFDGLGQSITGPNGTFTVNSVPPDPNLAVGTTQMVQTVNSGFAIYNKSTGAMTLGPYTIQTLWSSLPAGSACTGTETGAYGVSMSDPVVSFDNLAQRWIISVLALPYNSSGTNLAPFYHCIAYSTSADAGGGYDIFQYNPGSYVSGFTSYLPDYPKQGVWRDAYTFTYDMFNSGGTTYEGAVICGMDRNAIIGGSLSPAILCFKTPQTTSDYALLPVTIEGSTYPNLQTSGTAGTDTCSSGTPCQPKSVFFEVSSSTGAQTVVYSYRVHFNFVTTSHSAVDARVTTTVTSYNGTTCTTNTQKCATQPTHTGSLPSGETFASESSLDTLAYHAMWRAPYRNFGGYESVVLNHTVQTGSNNTAGLRWYELRGINTSTGTGTPTVQQLSTFTPDSTFRFMGSIAADHNNNMLLGYTGSSKTNNIFPSLYVTGRLVGDTVSTMETESKVFAGLNSQVNVTISGSSYAYGYRWGDYSSVVVDPDDCTFWYTNEYMAQAGLFNWSTRIFNWNFGTSNCTSPASMTLPIPNAEGGAALTSATATFLWTSGTGTPSYTLAVGSAQGGSNYFTQSYAAGTYSATVSTLPIDGSTFWVRLTTVGGVGTFTDYQYTAATLIQPCPITFTNPGTQTYGVAPIGLVATDPACNLPITFSLVSGPATVAGTTATITGAGTVVLRASQPGNGSYSPSTAQVTFTVNPALLTVTAQNANMTYGDSLPTFTYQMTGFVNGDTQGTATGGSPSLTTLATSSSPVGPYTITAALGSLTATNYTFAFVNGTLTIGQKAASVTPNAAGKIYGQSDPAFSGTLTGFLPADNVTATYTRTSGEGVAGSPYTISATLSPTGVLPNYNITYNTAQFTITPAAASVTPNAAGKTYGGLDPTLTGTLLGFLPGDGVTATYTCSNIPLKGLLPADKRTGKYSRVSCEAVGVYTISATLSPTGVLGNYNITYNTAPFTVGPATLTVTASNATITEGSSLPTFAYTMTGFQYTDNQGNSTSGQPDLTTTAPDPPPVGTYPINAAQGSLTAANYVFTFVSGTLTVNPAVAQITAPLKGTMFSGPTVNFTWSHETNAVSYQLWLGTTPGAQDVASATTSNLTTTFNGLPTDGSLIYATLNGSTDGTNWSTEDTGTYNAYSQIAVMQTPTPNSTFTGNTATFNWIAGAASSAYWIDVGSTYGGNDYYQSGNLNGALTATVNDLPVDGSTVYVTLWSLVGDQWLYNEYTYTAYNNASTKGVLTTPAPGSTLSGSSVDFTWTAGSLATAYWLDAGSTIGGNQYYQSGSMSSATLTTTATGLPTDGSTVYVTLYSLVNGQWLSNAYTYKAYSAQGLLGVLTTPTPGSTFTGSTVTFDWNAGSGSSAYWLDVGSTIGGNQYYQSGNLNGALTATVNGLPTDGSKVYVTLYSLVGGQWFSNGYTYTAYSTSSGLAGMLTPIPGSTLNGNVATFTWSAGTGVSAYWMDAGSTPGGNDYYQSGSLGALTTTVYTLPADGSTVYVTLYSQVSGQWFSVPYTYLSNP